MQAIFDNHDLTSSFLINVKETEIPKAVPAYRTMEYKGVVST